MNRILLLEGHPGRIGIDRETAKRRGAIDEDATSKESTTEATTAQEEEDNANTTTTKVTATKKKGSTTLFDSQSFRDGQRISVVPKPNATSNDTEMTAEMNAATKIDVDESARELPVKPLLVSILHVLIPKPILRILTFLSQSDNEDNEPPKKKASRRKQPTGKKGTKATKKAKITTPKTAKKSTGAKTKKSQVFYSFHGGHRSLHRHSSSPLTCFFPGYHPCRHPQSCGQGT